VTCDEYRLEGSDEYFEEFVRLQPGHQQRVTRLLEHLNLTPHASFPGVWPLRGEQLGIMEFRISQSHGSRRLFFTIDDDECVVHLEAIATHPDWNRGSDERSIRNL